MNKKAALAWEYIAVIIISLFVLLMVLIFSTTLKEKAIDGIEYFTTTLFGR